MNNLATEHKDGHSSPAAAAAAGHAGSDNCLAVGTRLADFEITGIVGEGGFGIVYLAFDHSLRRTVAIKEYMPVALAGRGPDNTVSVRSAKHKQAYDAGLQSYINEARLLAQFDHPSLVKVYRFWEQNQTAYMAMQYYEGLTLKQIAERQPALISQAWLLRMLVGVLAALQNLYSVNVLHRDISPENIMIQSNGVPVLLDFGAARQLASGSPQDLTVILKASFAPVEQYADDATLIQGPWTDIYALCAVIYGLISKKSPPSSVSRMIKDPLAWLHVEAQPGYDATFLAAINKGLQVLPHDRPQSIAEFCALLDIPAPKMPPPPARPAPMPAAPPKASMNTEANAPAANPAPAQSAPAAAASVPADSRPFAKVSPALPAAGRHFSYRAYAVGLALLAAAAGAAYLAAQRPTAPAASSPETASAAAGSPAAASVAVAESGPADAAVPASAVAVPNGADAKEGTADKSTASQAEAPQSSKLMLNIKPWGTVFVNGEQKGVSPPLKHLQLPPGKYQVKIVNPAFADYQTEIQVSNKKTAPLNVDFASQGKRITP